VGARTNWFHDVRVGKLRQILRARVGCPIKALEVRWVFVPPGILLPKGTVDTSKDRWIKVKLFSENEQDQEFDTFFIKSAYYDQLVSSEIIDLPVSTDTPCTCGNVSHSENHGKCLHAAARRDCYGRRADGGRTSACHSQQ
jgi:hypothetical protein